MAEPEGAARAARASVGAGAVGSSRCAARARPLARRRRVHAVGGTSRTLAARRDLNGVGAVGAPSRAASRALSRRQLDPPADGPLRVRPDQRGPPAAHELVPVSRPRFAAIPALPEPPLNDGGLHRHLRQPRRGVPLVHIPLARVVATQRLLVRTTVPAVSLDRRVGRGGGAVPRLGGRDRLRDEGVRLGGLRRVDTAVGVVDAPFGLGLHLPRPLIAAAPPSPLSSS